MRLTQSGPIDHLDDLDGMPLTEAIPLLAQKAALAEHRAEDLIFTWESWGLLSGPSDQQRIDLEPEATQYRERPEQFPEDVLRFLPGTVRNLWSRKALLRGGSELVQELCLELAEDRLDSFVRILPDPLRQKLDRRLAINMFAASVSLMNNLTHNTPAASLAEEILAVSLVERSSEILERWATRGDLEKDDLDSALRHLGDVFAFFEDSDIQQLFSEGARNFDLENTDWLFEPFAWAPGTGYLNPRGD